MGPHAPRVPCSAPSPNTSCDGAARSAVGEGANRCSRGGCAPLTNMFLALVEGSVVSTKKEASMNGRKLLVLRPQLVDAQDPTKFRPGLNTIVAVDSVGAGLGAGLKDVPIDAVVIGIVDVVDVLGKQIYSART